MWTKRKARSPDGLGLFAGRCTAIHYGLPSAMRCITNIVKGTATDATATARMIRPLTYFMP
jgi:hypothetical protein